MTRTNHEPKHHVARHALGAGLLASMALIIGGGITVATLASEPAPAHADALCDQMRAQHGPAWPCISIPTNTFDPTTNTPAAPTAGTNGSGSGGPQVGSNAGPGPGESNGTPIVATPGPSASAGETLDRQAPAQGDTPAVPNISVPSATQTATTPSPASSPAPTSESPVSAAIDRNDSAEALRSAGTGTPVPPGVWLIAGAAAFVAASPRTVKRLTSTGTLQNPASNLPRFTLADYKTPADHPVPVPASQLPSPGPIPRPFPPIPDEDPVRPSNNPSIPDRIWIAIGLARHEWSSKGWTFASALYEHFLGNTGDDYILSDQQASQAAAAAQGTTNVQLADIAQKATHAAQKDPSLYGKPQHFTSPWKDVYPTTDADVMHALGHYWTSVTATVVVTPTSNPEVFHTEIKYKVHIWDYYDFDMEYKNWIAQIKDMDFVTFAKVNVDMEMQWLRNAGFAKYFQVFGSTPDMTTSGGWSDNV